MELKEYFTESGFFVAFASLVFLLYTITSDMILKVSCAIYLIVFFTYTLYALTKDVSLQLTIVDVDVEELKDKPKNSKKTKKKKQSKK